MHGETVKFIAQMLVCYCCREAGGAVSSVCSWREKYYG